MQHKSRCESFSMTVCTWHRQEMGLKAHWLSWLVARSIDKLILTNSVRKASNLHWLKCRWAYSSGAAFSSLLQTPEQFLNTFHWIWTSCCQNFVFKSLSRKMAMYVRVQSFKGHGVIHGQCLTGSCSRPSTSVHSLSHHLPSFNQFRSHHSTKLIRATLVSHQRQVRW